MTILNEVHQVALIDAGRIGRQFVRQAVRFQGGADRAKFNKNEIENLVKDHVLLGRMTVCEYLLEEHKRNPYQSVDELIGDLQVIMSGEYNKLGKCRAHNKITVEDLIAEQQEAQGQQAVS